MNTFAFFDFDGTITKHDTFLLFGRHALGTPRFILSLVLCSPWLLAWKAGLISNSAAKEKLFSFLFRGKSLGWFSQRCHTFADTIDSDLRPDIMERLLWHLRKDHKVAIVSASVADWILPWAERHGIKDVISTEIELDNHGCLTGRFSTPNCHGEEKVRRIVKAFPLNVESETYAYGDSKGDDAMLNFVSHPVRV